MITVSQEFKNQLADGNRNYLVNVDITLADSTVIPTITKEGLTELSVEDAISQDNKFTALGGAVINKAVVTLDNSDESYSAYDFKGAVVTIQIGLQLENDDEYIDRGIYIVDSASPQGISLELSCLDYMSKFDKSYTNSEVIYPATIQEVIEDACTVCGVVFTGNYPDANYVLTIMPDASTFREVLSAIGQITGTFAHVDRQGRLYFSWFDKALLNTAISSNTKITGVHYIEDVVSNDYEKDNITIAGVRCYIINEESNEKFEYHYPSTLADDDFCLNLTGNPFIGGGNIIEIVDRVAQRIIGLTIRRTNCSHINNPLMEAGDVAMVLYAIENNDYIYYPIVITRTTFGVNHAQETICGVETLSENLDGRYDETQLLKERTEKQTNNAKKVATNYLSADTTGIMVADLADGIETPSTATGRNVKIDNDSVDIREGQDVLAQFGDITRIGKNDGSESYQQLDYHSLQMVDKAGNTYFHVSDLRGRGGLYELTENYILTTTTSSQTTISVGMYIAELVSVLINDVEYVQDATLSDDHYKIILAYGFNDGSSIKIIYRTNSAFAKAYTFGFRSSSAPNIGGLSVAEGLNTVASGFCSHAEGNGTSANAGYTHAEGYHTVALNTGSHAEGSNTTASGGASHAEGTGTTASGGTSHAEGANTTASNTYAHSEGYGTTASALNSHAEGFNTTASGGNSHAEGFNTVASGGNSHAEGIRTTASGNYSHAEGIDTVASGTNSHASGNGTIASASAQTVVGKFNTEQANALFIVGDGNSDSSRMNAFTVQEEGTTSIISKALNLNILPSSSQFGATLYFKDKNGTHVGAVQPSYTNDDLVRFGVYATRLINSTIFNSGLLFSVDNQGNATVDITGTGLASSFRTALDAVYKGGDTMTGRLTVQLTSDPYVATKKSDTDAQIGKDIPSETIQMGRFITLDSTGSSCGWVTTYRTAADHLYINLTARRKDASGTMLQNGLSLGIDASGNFTVAVSSASAWRSAIGAVNKGGDTITGGITHNVANSYFKSSNITRNTMASGLTYGNSRINFQDKDGNSMAQLRPVANTTYIGIELNTFKDGSTGNNLILAFDNNGTATVRMSAPSAWRTALGLAADSSWTTVSPVIAKKQGNVVTVSSNGNHSSAIPVNTYTDIATLPSGYRPSTTVYAAGILRSSYACIVRINTSGVVAVYSGNASAANGSFRFNLSFVI